jgi:hypothetical protein
MFNKDFLLAYMKSALDKGVKEGTRGVIQDLAEGLSEEHLGKLVDILQDVLTKKRANKVLTVDSKT